MQTKQKGKIVPASHDLKKVVVKRLSEVNPDFLGGAVSGIVTTFIVLGLFSIIF